MPVRVRMRWNGDAITGRVAQAAIQAVNETTAEAVSVARSVVPVDTGALKASLDARPAQQTGSGVSGEFGSYGIDYALYVELGTSRMRAQPYLRPGADAAFPGLPGRLAAMLK